MVGKTGNSKMLFPYLEDSMNLWRKTFEQIKNEEYYFASSRNHDLSSRDTQLAIFDTFREHVLDRDLVGFRDSLIAVNYMRDDILARYVAASVNEIQGWEGNKNLEIARYVVTQARDLVTNVVDKRVVPVEQYFREENIAEVVMNNLQNFAPQFQRQSSSSVKSYDLEVLSVSNLTGLFDMTKKTSMDVSPHDIKYGLFSRLKASYREMIKFIDWIMGLRSWEDYPYDAIGLITVVPDLSPEGKSSGSNLYRFGNFIKTKYAGDGFIKLCNNKEKTYDTEYGRKILIHKLGDEYDVHNYNNVIKQSRDIEKRIRARKNKELKNYEVEGLKQGHQYKHRVEESRAETWVMNKFMHDIYTGEFIGHNTAYISRREQERMAQLINPALSDAVKEEQKRKSKGKGSSSNARPLPSLNIVGNRIESMFIPVFNPDYISM
jgi:hypothetical protein